MSKLKNTKNIKNIDSAENIKTIESVEVSTLEQLESFTERLVKKMGAKTILLIDGPVGAGKTTTVQSLLRFVGFEGVTSPTFALHHTYQLQIQTVEHFDLYRIENLADLESTGFWDVFSRSNGWVIIEWSKHLVRDHLPRDWDIVAIDIEFLGDSAGTSAEVAARRIFTLQTFAY